MTSKKIWKLMGSSQKAGRLARNLGISELQAQLLTNRGIPDKISAGKFLRPRLSEIADPMLLVDMASATNRILHAIEHREGITVYGDYDADGLTATALLGNFFHRLGVPVRTYVPNRLHEGYGLNPLAVRRIAEQGGGLILTVDCGISGGEEIALAKSLGMDVIVTDHHRIPKDFHALCPVINPHRPDCRFPFKGLAGVGLAFFLAVSVRAALREKGWFTKGGEPDLRNYLDLVALGTLADRVPLLDQNRILTKHGMRTLKVTHWEGLKALKSVAGIHDRGLTTEDLVYRIAPHLNAPGRMDGPQAVMDLLTVDEPAKARHLAQRISDINSQRQRVEKVIFHEIEAQMEDEQQGRPVLVCAGEGWHPGVLGIVASRLVDRFYRPSLVFGIKDGWAMGSGRSIHGFDLYRALCQCDHLFEKFGGHAHAAGITMKAENLEVLREQMEKLACDTLGEEQLTQVIEIDAELDLEDINTDVIQDISALSPFGEANPEPLLLCRFVQVLDSRTIAGRHLKMKLGQGKRCLDAIGFGLCEQGLSRGERIDIVFTPEINCWGGYETIQLRIVDIQRSAGDSG